MIRKLRNQLKRTSGKWITDRKNPYIARLADDLECLLSYFEKVPKSRLSEIVIGTQLPKAKVQALLRIGPFDCDGRFWQFMDKNQNLKKNLEPEAL